MKEDKDISLVYFYPIEFIDSSQLPIVYSIEQCQSKPKKTSSQNLLWRNSMRFQICRGNKIFKEFQLFWRLSYHFPYFFFIFVKNSCWSIDFVVCFKSFCLNFFHHLSGTLALLCEFSLDLFVSHTHKMKQQQQKTHKKIRHSLAILYLESKLNTHNKV